MIGADAIANSGQTETNKILNELVPSFNFPQPSIADGTDALRPATLRGLSPDQTLVLVNGKRRHVSALLNINGTVGRGSAAVDLNLIPGLAISRIEVLRDGASSQYGSDAIAGVINIQLRSANHGGRATATYGRYETTLDDVARITGLQTNAPASRSSTRPTTASSSPTATASAAPMTARCTRSAPISACRSAQRLRQPHRRISPPQPDQSRRLRPPAELQPARRRRVRPARAELRPARVPLSATPRPSDYQLLRQCRHAEWAPAAGSSTRFGSYGHRDGLSAANYRQQNAAANRDFGTLAPNQTPTAANFVPLTPDGFLPYIDTDLEDYAGTIGMRGELGGWHTDLSLGYGHNSFDYIVRNTLNTSFGTASQSEFDAGGLRYGQTRRQSRFLARI